MLKTISLISTIVLLVNCILYLKSFQNRTKAFKVFALYLVVISVIQVVSLILGRLQIGNIYFSHFYFIIQFGLLSFFYKLIYKKNSNKRFVNFTFTIVTIVLTIQYVFDPSLFFQFNLLEIVICSLPIVVFSFLYFFQILDKNSREYIFINSGIFFYLLCSTLIFVTGKYVSPKQTFWYQFIWVINAFLYLAYQVLIFIEWYKHFRKKEITS